MITKCVPSGRTFSYSPLAIRNTPTVNSEWTPTLIRLATSSTWSFRRYMRTASIRLSSTCPTFGRLASMLLTRPLVTPGMNSMAIATAPSAVTTSVALQA